MNQAINNSQIYSYLAKFIVSQDTVIYRLVVRNLSYDAYFSVLNFWATFGGKMGMRASYGLGPPNPTKKLAWSFWVNRYLKIMFSKFSGVKPLKMAQWAKRSAPWAKFLVGFGGPRPLGTRVVVMLISLQKWPQNQKLKISIITWISHRQSIGNGLLSSHKKSAQ